MNLKKLILSVLCLLLIVVPVAEAAQEMEVSTWQKQTGNYKEAKFESMDFGPKLLFSDSPEMVTSQGIMYQDVVEGDVRIFFHHVNATQTVKKLAIIVHNKGFRPMQMTRGQYGVSKPSKDWLYAGKEVQVQYFTPQPPETLTLPLNGEIELLTHKSGVNFRPGELVTGMLDLHFSEPVAVTVLMTELGNNVFAASEQLAILPPDSGKVLRGTFLKANRRIKVKSVYKTGKKDLAVLLADDKVDKFLTGIDATTGKSTTNYGNYGVVYEVAYRFKSKKEGVVLGFNPWGGIYAGAGLTGLGESAELELIPPQQVSFGKTGKEMLVLEVLQPTSDGNFVFSPPGSSNLPIRLILKTNQTEK